MLLKVIFCLIKFIAYNWLLKYFNRYNKYPKKIQLINYWPINDYYEFQSLYQISTNWTNSTIVFILMKFWRQIYLMSSIFFELKLNIIYYII